MKNKKRNIIIAVLMVLTVLILVCIDSAVNKTESYETADALIKPFAKENGIRFKEYPDEIRKMLENNPETLDFVLNYPLLKDKPSEGLHKDEITDFSRIPYLSQFDLRWGYEDYAGSIMGIAGCGPTCLSMVSIFLLKDSSLDPLYVADFAEREGYATYNNGTKWLLMSEGAEKLGLESEELPLDKNIMENALKEGRPIILIMGAGDFTSSGHYIVLTDCSEEGFTVLDPYSKERSSVKWTYERIEGQIRNIWAYRVNSEFGIRNSET